MPVTSVQLPDLMPPAFSEGLCEWSRGDGTPDTPAYDTAFNARLARNDPEFGDCLELRKVERIQRLRYMGEVPLPRGAFIEISTRVRAVRGPLPTLRVGLFAGGIHGDAVGGVPLYGPEVSFGAHDEIRPVSAVVGPVVMPGVDLVWDARAVYAHVGLDILGEDNSVVRIENLAVREATMEFGGGRVPLPGFEGDVFVVPRSLP